ncbi:hypothetical protein EB796_001968 [Bugula neritina]|uniref:Uncharacterized protein n=1 Tax=Bugula neritina TaxID=10212 RepID=A0A7J7KNJ2_BUGNE|nr:hypothetical protein EB796_001968 [Bugula neritina]
MSVGPIRRCGVAFLFADVGVVFMLDVGVAFLLADVGVVFFLAGEGVALLTADEDFSAETGKAGVADFP